MSIDNEAGKSLWSHAWAKLRKSFMAMSCLAVVVVFAATALYGSVIYWRYSIIDAEMPGFMEPVRKVAIKVLAAEKVVGQLAPYQEKNLDIRYQAPSREHIMGTDGLGRDVFQRLVQGARIAFQVGVITSLIAIPIAVILGCLAGYYGGRIDDFVVWLYSTFSCMPSLLFIISIAMVVGKGLAGVYIGIGFTTWVHLCRLIRAEVLKRKELTYVRAAQTLGFSGLRIIFRHIMPNLMHIIIINFSLRFPAAVQTEVIMSFLGIGAQGEPSWGLMINSARFRLWHGVWWELTFTTLAIFVIVLSFNLLGDALRDALDPRLRGVDE